jgi:hypothetical protein
MVGCRVPVTSHTGSAWSAEEAKVGEEVTITASAVGIEDGAQVMITIQQVTDQGLSDVEVLPPAEVRGGEIEATWTYKEPDEDTYEAAIEAGGAARMHMPVYVAEILVEGYPRTVSTNVLSYKDKITVTITDREGEPRPNVTYKIVFASGDTRTGKTDSNGSSVEKDIPVGGFKVMPIQVEDQESD